MFLGVPVRNGGQRGHTTRLVREVCRELVTSGGDLLKGRAKNGCSHHLMVHDIAEKALIKQ